MASLRRALFRRPVFRHITLADLSADRASGGVASVEAKFAVWTGRVCFLLIALGVAVSAWHPLSGGDDVWAHAAIGRWIWEHKAVPHQTLFQWATAPIPWIAHSWATQLTFFVLLQTGGPLAIVLLNIAMSLLPFALIWRDWSQRMRGSIGLVAPLFFALAITISEPRFRPRPELFSALALVVLLLFLTKWPQRPAWQLLYLPLLFCVWANFHGGVALGLAVLMITVFGDALQETFARFRPARSPLLFCALLGCAAAVFINPYGLQYIAALKPVAAGSMFSQIDEWKPYWKAPTLSSFYVHGEFLLWGATVLAWIANPRRRWAHCLWLLVLGASFIEARRQMWLLPLTCLCVAEDAVIGIAAIQWNEVFARHRSRKAAPDPSENVPLSVSPEDALAPGTVTTPPPPLPADSEAPASEARPSQSRPSSWVAPALWRRTAQVALVAILSAWLLRHTPRVSELRTRGVVEDDLPVQATAKLQQMNPRRLFNDYEYSSYLQWRFGGRPRLFIDLLNAYPDSILTDYLAMLNVDAQGRILWASKQPDAVYVRPHGSGSSLATLAGWLSKNSDWKRVYTDKDGDIWINKTLYVPQHDDARAH